MPSLGAREGTVSEPQGKLPVTKRSILGTKEEEQADQRAILD